MVDEGLTPEIEGIIHSWDKCLDNAKYLGVEYRHKEKEYGIKWRAAYKRVLRKETDKLVKKQGNPFKNADGEEEPEAFEIIMAIVGKDHQDMETFKYGK